MSERMTVTGMVISSMVVNEYDKRLVILTTDRGKITGFARGAKRPGNLMMAAAEKFVFGEFVVSEGRNAYSIHSAKVSNYFEELRSDLDATCYGCYFLEFADYYGRENADDLEMLKLLYQTVRALCKKTIPMKLIRCIFELKMMVVNGEFPECFECSCCHKTQKLAYFSALKRGVLCEACRPQGGMNVIPIDETILYTLQYIIASPIEKLYTFKVSDEVLDTLMHIIRRYRNMYVDGHFKSLEMVTMLEEMNN